MLCSGLLLRCFDSGDGESFLFFHMVFLILLVGCMAGILLVGLYGGLGNN